MLLRMKVIKGKPQGHCLSFPVGEFMFGRGPECDVRPNSDLISRQHCLLQVNTEGAFIRDLGSRNGTLVNGELVTGQRVLAHSDTVQIGPLVLEVLLDASQASPDASMKDTAMVDRDDTATNQPVVMPDASDTVSAMLEPPTPPPTPAPAKK